MKFLAITSLSFLLVGHISAQEREAATALTYRINQPGKVKMLLPESESLINMGLDLVQSGAAQDLAVNLNENLFGLTQAISPFRQNASKGNAEYSKQAVREISKQIATLDDALSQTNIDNLKGEGLHRIHAIQTTVKTFVDAMKVFLKDITDLNQQFVNIDLKKLNRRAEASQNEKIVALMNSYDEQALRLKQAVDQTSHAINSEYLVFENIKLVSNDREERADAASIQFFLRRIANITRNLYTSFAWEVPLDDIYKSLEPGTKTENVFLFFGRKEVKEYKTLGEYADALQQMVSATGQTVQAFSKALDELTGLLAEVDYRGKARSEVIRVYTLAVDALVEDSLNSHGLKESDWQLLRNNMITAIDTHTVPELKVLITNVSAEGRKISEARREVTNRATRFEMETQEIQERLNQDGY
ncbi:MAG: hypothetical protein COV44_00245 [Deltaproteobacteria bacterium CG11_big_fil_rev_8_21_14_0_20_45_16]|nr:MAG: hypothetical protein COV44_00245 [Deltaproteobacteria bacterium CG11_big_fil_rev_8_21_14_0_20_45_16]